MIVTKPFLRFALLSLLFFMVLGCESEKIVDPALFERPELASPPVVAFADTQLEIKAGVTVTKEMILDFLSDPANLTIKSSNEAHTGKYKITIADFAQPPVVVGYLNVTFSVADSTGLETTKILTINIIENNDPGTLTFNYSPTTVYNIPWGTNPENYRKLYCISNNKF